MKETIKNHLEKRIDRRTFVKLAGTTLVGLSALGFLAACTNGKNQTNGGGSGGGNDFPTKSITNIVPADPGGGWDNSSRIATQFWEKHLGQPFHFEYVPGSGSQIAFQKLVDSPPDGHTIAICSITQVAPMIYTNNPKFGWDDLAFIGNLISEPDILIVHKDSPYNSIDEFIEASKKSTEPFSISVSLPLSSTQLVAVMLREATGANLNIIPYGGGGPSRQAVVTGEVDACLAPYWSALSVYESTKGIGIFDDVNPAPHIWDMPVANEVLGTNIPNIVEPYSFYVPSAIKEQHPDNYKKLVDTFKEVVTKDIPADKEDKQRLQPFLDYRTPEECEAFVDDFMTVFTEYEDLMRKEA